jgi:hypothetical protein
VAQNRFVRFYNFLAKMGLVIRDDPPKVIDMTGRVWGEPVDGLALSIRELPREEPNRVAGISVVMKNTGAHPKTLSVPPWIFYYEIAGLTLTPYGRQLMSADRKAEKSELTLGPGDAIETDLPIGTIFNMRTPGEYPVQVSCLLPDESTLRSNAIGIRV